MAQADGFAIHNPVLPGFHPDPSIVRVGADYYIATSSFEWFPAVPIHHSTDLVHWRLIGHALTDPSHVDLRGVPDSAGVWAPSLSYHDGRFWLVYSIVRTVERPFKDVDNYLVTAPGPLGPWSEPVYLNSSGFDPSLFHDEDGRRWLVNMRWDFRPGRDRFAGIVLQEYDDAERRLVGAPVTLLRSETLIEGPNLYRRAGWYHLMLAEGGTGWEHGIRVARSRFLVGPYELDPSPLLTTRDSRDHPLQKAGHGELVETPDGEWFLAHLASRPVHSAEGPRCVLGRETCLQRVEWSADDRLRLAGGGTEPRVTLPGPAGTPARAWPAPPDRDDFDRPVLDPGWSTLRAPADASWLSLTERPGRLRLRGRQSPRSLFDQSLVAKRLVDVRCEARTSLRFDPGDFSQLAGLICWYDTSTYYYLHVTHAEGRGRVLGLLRADDGTLDEVAVAGIDIGTWRDVHLRVRWEVAELWFSASPDGEAWQEVGPCLDATILSDDHGSRLRFTGAFVGLCAHDLGSGRAVAEFDYFTLTGW